MSSNDNNNTTPAEDPDTATQGNNGDNRTTADGPNTQQPEQTQEPEPTTPTREPTTTPTPNPEPEPTTPDAPPETNTPAQNTPTRNPETIITSTKSDTVVTLVSTVTTAPVTETPSPPAATLAPVSSSAISPSASASGDTNESNSSGGLSGTTRVVVAVVVPIVGVALIAIGLLFLWKKRRRDRELKEQRRKEVEDYGFNPNSPGINGGGVTPEGEQPYEMSENTSVGYRGWGSTNGGRNGGRQVTNMGSIGTSGALSPVGMAFPEGTYQDPNGYAGVAQSPSAASFPPGAPSTDGNTSNAPLIGNQRPDTADSAVMAAIAAVGGAETGDGGIHRGISNASSNYSGVTHSDHSDIGIPPQHYQMEGPMGGYEEHNYSGPYQPYPEDGAIYSPPVIRDVSARRNTQIETPTSAHFPQQGNSGIAQNF